MQCFICKEETTDKRRKKCPICGSKLSFSKYDNHIFPWTNTDINYINDIKSKMGNNTTENAKIVNEEKAQGETTSSKPSSNSSKKKQRELAREEYKKKSSEKRAADRKKEKNKKSDIKYGLQLLAAGSACALFLGLNFSTMSLLFIIITFAAAMFFLLGAFLMLFGSKEE